MEEVARAIKTGEYQFNYTCGTLKLQWIEIQRAGGSTLPLLLSEFILT